MNKDVKALLRKLRKAGYHIATPHGSSHWKVYDQPGGRMLASVPCSPSDSHAMANLRSDLRKAGVTL